MLGRHVYRVHLGDGKLERDQGRRGASRAAAFGRREEALAEACRLAEADQPSRVSGR